MDYANPLRFPVPTGSLAYQKFVKIITGSNSEICKEIITGRKELAQKLALGNSGSIDAIELTKYTRDAFSRWYGFVIKLKNECKDKTYSIIPVFSWDNVKYLVEPWLNISKVVSILSKKAHSDVTKKSIDYKDTCVYFELSMLGVCHSIACYNASLKITNVMKERQESCIINAIKFIHEAIQCTLCVEDILALWCAHKQRIFVPFEIHPKGMIYYLNIYIVRLKMLDILLNFYDENQFNGDCGKALCLLKYVIEFHSSCTNNDDDSWYGIMDQRRHKINIEKMVSVALVLSICLSLSSDSLTLHKRDLNILKTFIKETDKDARGLESVITQYVSSTLEHNDMAQKLTFSNEEKERKTAICQMCDADIDNLIAKSQSTNKIIPRVAFLDTEIVNRMSSGIKDSKEETNSD